MWKIRSLTKKDNHGRPMYWANDVGWTWKDTADVYTEVQKASTLLPRDAVWEEVE